MDRTDNGRNMVTRQFPRLDCTTEAPKERDNRCDLLDEAILQA